MKNVQKAKLIFAILTLIAVFSSCIKNRGYDNNNDDNVLYCNITSPNNNAQLPDHGVVTIFVEAGDPNGNIVEIKYYLDDVYFGSSYNYPYFFDWNVDQVVRGTHTLKAECINEKGLKKSDVITIRVGDGNGGYVDTIPLAGFSNNKFTGTAPLTVHFFDKSSNSPTSWLWDFGDNNTSTEQNPVHTYNNENTYTVSLTVTNSYGSNTLVKQNLIRIGYNLPSSEPCPGTPTVTDLDGNVYNTVLIGNQCWMKENLNVGVKIDSYADATNNSVIEKYCYNNVDNNCDTYGGLYQWNELVQYNEGNRQGICPYGWHIPSDEEWKALEIYLGMSPHEANQTDLRGESEGGYLKSQSGWTPNGNLNGNGSNVTGFTALPGGWCDISRNFNGISNGGFFWTRTSASQTRAWHHSVNHFSDGISRFADFKNTAVSVRCIKD